MRTRVEKSASVPSGVCRHFCASVYVYEPVWRKFLMIRHKKLRRWMPPGGHVEENERPDVAAVREALEETGFLVQLIGAPMAVPCADCETVYPQPFGLRTYEPEPGHEHMGFIYCGIPVAGALEYGEARPGAEAAWLSEEEIGSMETFSDIPHWCRYFTEYVPQFLTQSKGTEDHGK
jgi:8-oxo-dGTP pyrophosphatase MutT (NUDIX family)